MLMKALQIILYSVYCCVQGVDSVVKDGLSICLSHHMYHCMHASKMVDPSSSRVHPACVYRWWSVVSLFLLFNAGTTQCLSFVCHGRPSSCCWVPCHQDGGAPLWLWWCWIHSLALGSPSGSVVLGEVPCEILRIWSKRKGQGWPIFVYARISSASIECFSLCHFIPLSYFNNVLWGFLIFPVSSIGIVNLNSYLLAHSLACCAC